MSGSWKRTKGEGEETIDPGDSWRTIGLQRGFGRKREGALMDELSLVTDRKRESGGGEGDSGDGEGSDLRKEAVLISKRQELNSQLQRIQEGEEKGRVSVRLRLVSIASRPPSPFLSGKCHCLRTSSQRLQ